MNKPLAGWATSLLTLVGTILVCAFFVAWVSDGTSGLSLAWHEEHWLFLIPLSGVALAATSQSKSPHVRLAAVIAGLLVAGDLSFEMLRGVLHGGLDLWLMLGGAALVLAGVPEKHKSLRTVGGIAVLAGFFAPWTSESLFRGLIGNGAEFAAAIGISIKVLWLIPVAGIAAAASAGLPGVRGRNVAAISGVAVFASMLWMIGSVANLVFAWGAWSTLAASATALVIGVIAPSDGSQKTNAKTNPA